MARKTIGGLSEKQWSFLTVLCRDSEAWVVGDMYCYWQTANSLVKGGFAHHRVSKEEHRCWEYKVTKSGMLRYKQCVTEEMSLGPLFDVKG